MRVVMIVPTGLGCSIGGHAGDANPAAKLLSTVCDELIVHPNVVNGSDINEMRENCLYVDGYALDEFLRGKLALRRIRSGANKILVVTNTPTSVETNNAVGAARATLGLEAQTLALDEPLVMKAGIHAETGAAIGLHGGVDELIKQVSEAGEVYDYDAVAISSEIDVDKTVAETYLRDGGVNPWGKVESDVCRKISAALCVPVAHAPIDGVIGEWNEVVDDRRAAECVSVAYLHCVLKGLQRAPTLIPMNFTWRPGSPCPTVRSDDLTVEDIDMLISPTNCWGPPHEACMLNGIEVVWVSENYPAAMFKNPGHPMRMIKVVSYLEAAGLIAARRVGVSMRSVSSSMRKS